MNGHGDDVGPQIGAVVTALDNKAGDALRKRAVGGEHGHAVGPGVDKCVVVT